MNESVWHSERATLLAGVTTESGRPGAPMVVIPNAYVTPHVGLFRMHVELARGLALQGVDSLRFDVSGIGDSADPSGSEPYARRTRDELAGVVDEIAERWPGRTVVLLGHCDGAHHALHIARQDRRVRGFVCIDGFLEPGLRQALRTRWRHLSGRLERMRSGELRRSDEDGSARSLRDVIDGEAAAYGANRTLAELDAGLAALRERGAPSLWVASSEFARFGRLRRLRGRLHLGQGLEQLARIPSSSHVYAEVGARTILVERVCGWFADRREW